MSKMTDFHKNRHFVALRQNMPKYTIGKLPINSPDHKILKNDRFWSFLELSPSHLWQ